MTVKTVLADVIQNMALRLAEQEERSQEREEKKAEQHRVELSAAKQEKESLTQRLAELEAKDSELEKRLAAAEVTNRSLALRLAEAYSSVAEVEEEAEKWKEEYDFEHAMHKDCGPWMQRQNDHIATLRNEQHQTAVALVQKQVEVDKLTETNHALKTKLEQYAKQQDCEPRALRKRKHN